MCNGDDTLGLRHVECTQGGWSNGYVPAAKGDSARPRSAPSHPLLVTEVRPSDDARSPPMRILSSTRAIVRCEFGNFRPKPSPICKSKARQPKSDATDEFKGSSTPISHAGPLSRHDPKTLRHGFHARGGCDEHYRGPGTGRAIRFVGTYPFHASNATPGLQRRVSASYT